MIKKIVLLVFIIIIFSFCSCTEQNDVINNTNSNNSMTIYLRFKGSSYFVNQAVKRYEADFPSIKVNKIFFENNEEYEKKLSVDTMSGEGPDIFILDTLLDSMSINKAINIGVFCELNSLIIQDNDFDMTQYNPDIINCGIFYNKRYLMPLNYNVQTFLTTEEILNVNGINPDTENWSLEYLSNFVKIFNNESNGNKVKKFFSDHILFSNFVQSNGYEINNENKKGFFGDKLFIDILNIYKDSNNKLEQTMYTGLPCGQDMKDGLLIAYNGLLLFNPYEIYSRQSEIKFYNDGTIRLLPLPTYDAKQGLTAQVINLVAINQYCKNKKPAFNFIKILLSEEIQGAESFNYMPVNNNVINDVLEKLSSENANGKRGDKHLYCLDEKLVNDIKAINNNIIRSIISNKTINNFMNKAAEEYFNNKYTSVEAIDNMKNNILLYLDE